MFDKDGERRLQIQAYGAGGGQAVISPPLSGSLDLALRARLDSNDERQRSTVPAKPFEQLFCRDALLAVGLIKCVEKLGFLLR